ncbi:MAG: nucleotidyl transferase AbiEii/AbiGii toxin family protein [bacterium]|nr:nucleotidyl transferase AbiEii/AbiGii toxin family protein [bacterium]
MSPAGDSGNRPAADPLAQYRRVLSDEVRAAWPILAGAVADIDGYLAGGTALATHLRHRRSYDLDYMAHQPFSGQDLFDRIAATARHAVCSRAEPDRMFASVEGAAVEVFAPPRRGEHPGHVRRLAPPSRLAGMRIASLADLLAMKIDVIMYRPKLRDFMDLAAIDNHGQFTLEDGLALHMQRYGTQPHSTFLDRIVDRIETPGPLPADPEFAAHAPRALDHLAARVPQLRSHIARTRRGTRGSGEPAPRSGPAGTLAPPPATRPECGRRTAAGRCRNPQPPPGGKCAAGHERPRTS